MAPRREKKPSPEQRVLTAWANLQREEAKLKAAKDETAVATATAYVQEAGLELMEAMAQTVDLRAIPSKIVEWCMNEKSKLDKTSLYEDFGPTLMLRGKLLVRAGELVRELVRSSGDKPLPETLVTELKELENRITTTLTDEGLVQVALRINELEVYAVGLRTLNRGI